jgi:hypothetical protein
VPEPLDVSEAANNATIDRKDFDAVLRKLIAAPPISKHEASRKIKLLRYPFRRLTKRPHSH